MWLKRRTPQNIVIGGAAGAFPPMIGWAAVTGSLDLGEPALFLHHLHVDAAAFLGAGALRARRLCAGRRADAAGRGGRGGNPPADPDLYGAVAADRVAAGAARRRRLALCGIAAILGVGLFSGLRRCGAGAIATAGERNRAAKRLFGFSMLYLFALFFALSGRASGRACRLRAGSDEALDHAPGRRPSSAEEHGAPAHAALDRHRAGACGLVVLFFITTIVRLGGNVAERAL